MLRSNRGLCSSWNALVAIAETKNKLSLRVKTALFTNLQYTGKGIGMRTNAVKSYKWEDSLKLTCSNDL